MTDLDVKKYKDVFKQVQRSFPGQSFKDWSLSQCHSEKAGYTLETPVGNSE